MIGPSIHPPSQPRFVNQLADDDAYVHFVESRIWADRGTKGQTISLSFSHWLGASINCLIQFCKYYCYQTPCLLCGFFSLSFIFFLPSYVQSSSKWSSSSSIAFNENKREEAKRKSSSFFSGSTNPCSSSKARSKPWRTRWKRRSPRRRHKLVNSPCERERVGLICLIAFIPFHRCTNIGAKKQTDDPLSIHTQMFISW